MPEGVEEGPGLILVFRVRPKTDQVESLTKVGNTGALDLGGRTLNRAVCSSTRKLPTQGSEKKTENAMTSGLFRRLPELRPACSQMRKLVRGREQACGLLLRTL